MATSKRFLASVSQVAAKPVRVLRVTRFLRQNMISERVFKKKAKFLPQKNSSRRKTCRLLQYSLREGHLIEVNVPIFVAVVLWHRCI